MLFCVVAWHCPIQTRDIYYTLGAGIRGAGVNRASTPHFYTLQQRIMAPSTPPGTPASYEYDTIRRTRFFNAFDSAKIGASVGSIARLPHVNIPPSTARRWLKQREKLGNEAFRRTRRRSSILGRRSMVSASVLDTITNQEDPIHEKSYADQVAELELPCKPRTLQHHAAMAGAR